MATWEDTDTRGSAVVDARPRRGARPAALLGQVARFAAVGGMGLVVDVGLFNLLLLAAPAGTPAWPIVAKSVSLLAAIAVNWIGSRTWTFRTARRRADVAREAGEFLAVSLLGSAVALACLFVSHYVLQATSALADNLSANVVGLVLGSAVRFVAYRNWVFSPRRAG